MRKNLLLFFLFCFATLGTALGQNITVKGTVLDENSDPVMGATVRLKSDATKGAITDMDGRFTLQAKSGETILITYVGYKDQEVKAAPTLTVRLVPDNKLLDEVMVVAYGTAKKESFTGSAVVVDSKKLEKVQANDAAKALEGAVPGLQISSSSGAPGSGTTIRIRGIGSINGSNAPLIILNGAPYDGNINSINPRDIESINVLKDAASAALYGARGANGVLIITTKNGKEGLTQVTFDARVGQNSRAVPEYDLITDPGSYYELTWEALRNSYVYADKNPLNMEAANQEATNTLIGALGYNIYNVPDNAVVGTDGKLNPKAQIKYEDAANFNDWTSVLMSPKMRQEYNLSISRGTEKSNTFLSIGYLNDQGYAIKTNFDRITSRIAYTNELYKWLKVSASSQLAYTTGNFGNSDNGAFVNVFNWTRNIAPIYPVYLHDAEGKIISENGEQLYDTGVARKGINGARQFSANKNIVGETELDKDQYKRLYVTTNGRVDVDLTHGFTFNSTFTHYFLNNRALYFKNKVMGDGISYGGLLEKSPINTTTINWNQLLNYQKDFGDFNLNVLLGHETYSYNYDYIYGSKTNTLDPNSTNLNTYAQTSDLTSYERNYRVEGYFGQVTADYKERYYISASLRRDGSSVFAPDKRWGTFWSAGASWRLENEEFMKDVRWINNLKLRASVGQQGSDVVNDEGGFRMYTPYATLYKITNDGTNNSIAPEFLGNPDLTWEKNLNVSLGLEFTLLDRRLSGELDFYTRRTSDLLFNEPVTSTTGFTFKPMNLGAMRNTGFEFRLDGTIVRTNDVTWTVGINGATYKNTILTLPERFRENGLPMGARILKEGGSIYDYWLVKYVGVNPKDGDANYQKWNDADLAKEPKPGEFVTVGSADYREELRDRQFIGSAIPDLEGGINTSLTAYGVDFSAQLSYRIGGIMFDKVYSSLMHPGNLGSTWHSDIMNRWTPGNKDTNIPRLQMNSNKLIQRSDMFIVNASYIALRNVTLGYSLPRTWLEKAHLQNVRIYFSGDNLFVKSARKGLDPRASVSGSMASYNVAGAVRTISGGLTLTF